nr:hypothetical protein [Microbacterium bovistercoris]
MDVLGIDVAPVLAARWREWLMPACQPFVIPGDVATVRGWSDERAELTFEVADAFELYDVARDQAIVFLDRTQARSLPPDLRRTQRARHRWPTGDVSADIERTVRFVERARLPSRHTEVTEWILPGARELGGTFPDGSGPNCFGVVMAAAGVTGAAGKWMQIAPFERWVEASTIDGGSDDEPGTVLLWRDQRGEPAHAAVTLGGGYALNKSSQGWMSPTQVLTVREVINRSRYRGLRLERRRIV